MGRYGQKTGAGWYKYDAPGSRNRTPDPLIDQLAEDEARRRGIARRPVSDEEIVARITTALANEGARVLEEHFATRAGDIDVIYVLRLRLPALSRRPDVLRGDRRPGDGAVARQGIPARGSATTGSRRRCSSGSSPRVAGSTANSRLAT